MNTKHLKKIDDIMKEMTDAGYAAGASTLILENGKEVYYGAAGFMDIVNKKKVKRDTIFRLYSMTKPVTAAAVMCLVEDGLIDLNSPVGDYIPTFKGQKYRDAAGLHPVKRDAKIKDLLNMTAGLTYEGNKNDTELAVSALVVDAKKRLDKENEMTTMEFAERLGEIPLIFSPGESFNYSFGADVLGAVAEAVTGKKFGEYLNERFFKPMDMKDTGFFVQKKAHDRLTKVYRQVPGGLEEFTDNHLAINLAMEHAPAFESGGAGLATTLDDYAKFAKMLMNFGAYEGKQIMQEGTVRWFTAGELDKAPQEAFKNWDGLQGFTYGNLMRVMKHPGRAALFASEGEYGWDGWLGPYFANDPAHKVTILHMLQRTDAGTTPYMRRIRNVVMSSIKE
ncbi:MAG: beta-lactamase family protein [Lachnospiraceae bacterium]|nr:beta-lactamase family protein [Lachnospiraceae bacterium]